ncbi:MAG TPA: fused response regulator/phosphatase [Tepidisphaeraceae bacterium]|nr:fused response regulator/phosphatase [Tepidisphaeraceae bacterium]
MVLLVDDQPLVGRAVQEMLRPEPDIQFHFCSDPYRALELAIRISPTVILQDLSMPNMSGFELLNRLRTDHRTQGIPAILLSNESDPQAKAQAFALGADDYLVKLPDRVELIARIRRHSRSFWRQQARERDETRRAENERRLHHEIVEAGRYVESLLPTPIEHGPVQTRWRFLPSMRLGGDAFGFQWLDDAHFAFYLLDVSGHGVESALLAVSVLNILSCRALADTDSHDPAAVMRALNTAFDMEKHNRHFFTIWYGVYNVWSRELVFSGGGHPPPMLCTGESRPIVSLETQGMPIGVFELAQFENERLTLPSQSRIILYSDGVVEVGSPSAMKECQSDFKDFLNREAMENDIVERIEQRAKQLANDGEFKDDFSLLQIDFA